MSRRFHAVGSLGPATIAADRVGVTTCCARSAECAVAAGVRPGSSATFIVGSSPRRPPAVGGFTLIEVLIALVIAATALALGFGAVQGSAQRLAQVEQSTLAGWAIDNVVSDLMLRGASIRPGRQRYVETMLGRTLLLDADVQRSETPPRLSIDISVKDAASPEIVIDTAQVQTLLPPPTGGLDASQPR